MIKAIETANNFIDFISQSPTKYHAVDYAKSKLIERGFKPLSINEHWELMSLGRYFIEQDNSALIAFCMPCFNEEQGLENISTNGLRLVCAHTDSPTFKIKPVSDIKSKDNYIQLNTQAYTWPILTSWFDRPLSFAGRVALKNKDSFHPEIHLVDIEDPLLLIPSLAFHLKKGKTDGNISKQKEMLPIMGIANNSTNNTELLDIIATKLNITKEAILEYELYLYPVEKGRLVGINSDFIVSPRQDDLVMVYAALHALIGAELDLYNSYSSCPSKLIDDELLDDSRVRMVAFFDAEEETNSTLGGADTPFLKNVLTKIIKSVKGDEEDLMKLINNSIAASLDIAFASHPNYSEYNDPTCTPVMNKGVVIKYDANMHYSTTAFTSAVFQEVCNRGGVPFQKANDNSDFRTGGTISAFLQTQVEMKCVEIGIPSWATHSAYECCGTIDLFNLIVSLKKFFTLNDVRYGDMLDSHSIIESFNNDFK